MARLALMVSTAVLLMAANSQAVAGASGLKVVQRIAGPDGGWDLVSFDNAHRRVFVTHGTSVLTIAADTGAVTAIGPGDRLHAAVPVANTDLLVTTNSGDNTARVFDAASGKLVATVAAGKKPDSAIYDPSSGFVLVMNGDSGDVTEVDARAGKAAGSIPVGGALEFGDVDGKGRLYVNVEDKNEVAVVDIARKTVLARYPLAGCMGPTGLAYVSGARLVSACGDGTVKILDAATGREIASLKVGGFPDAVIYDRVRSLAYVPSARDGMLNVIALSGPANNTIIDTVPTQIGARTGAVDVKTGRVYLPTAEYAAAAPGQRPTTKPGTFVVLVLDRK